MKQLLRNCLDSNENPEIRLNEQLETKQLRKWWGEKGLKL